MAGFFFHVINGSTLDDVGECAVRIYLVACLSSKN
jgi:hypothetical protein